MGNLDVLSDLIILQSWNINVFFYYFGLHWMIMCQSVDVY